MKAVTKGRSQTARSSQRLSDTPRRERVPSRTEMGAGGAGPPGHRPRTERWGRTAAGDVRLGADGGQSPYPTPSDERGCASFRVGSGGMGKER